MTRSQRLNPSASFEPDAPRMPPSAHLVVRMLDRLSVGSLSVRFPDGRSQRYGDGAPHGEIVLHNWKVCDAALRSGDIGFGETYIAGDWTSPDLPALLDVMVANRRAIEAVIYGTWWGRILYRVKHLANRNSRTGSRRNIHAHYDIGNAFYALWLDESMTYSSACFADGRLAAEASPRDDFAMLPRAQAAKYDRVMAQLDLQPGARVLEIGCGWGGFARAASARGAHVTGVTLSEGQFAWAREHTAASTDGGPAFQLRDYRSIVGRYDAIVSIEMFEAVGERYWPSYFECLVRCLPSGGRATIQTITIADELFDDYRRGSDFIQQYVFPGGMLPTATLFRSMAEQAGFDVIDQHAFGQDYARTLAAWLWCFDQQEAAVRELGFDTAFIHTWRFYLAYCIAAFANANTDVVQFTLERRPA